MDARLLSWVTLPGVQAQQVQPVAWTIDVHRSVVIMHGADPGTRMSPFWAARTVGAHSLSHKGRRISDDLQATGAPDLRRFRSWMDTASTPGRDR